MNTQNSFSIGDSNRLLKIKEVLESAAMGIWRITLRSGQKPRMEASDEMLVLLGIDKNSRPSEEEIYETWYNNIMPESRQVVDEGCANMTRKERMEIVYKWRHPVLGVRCVRCGGVGYAPGYDSFAMEGYHYDITELEKQKAQGQIVVNALANLYSCMFYIDVNENSYIAYFNSIPLIKNYFSNQGNLKTGLKVFADYLCVPSEKENVQKFTDLATLNERLRYQNSISIQFQGTIINWVRFTFIVSDRNPDGTIHHMVATLSDISDQRRVEMQRVEELKENIDANKSKTMMLQNMTHEIRTPLNAMFGFSQLLCMPGSTLTDDQKAEYYNYIFNSFNMLSMLIDDVMDMTDAEHGNYRIQIGTVEVNKVCRAAMQMAEMRLLGGVKLYFVSDIDDSYTIQSDGRRIEQVLVNFLTNACKHTQKGEIRLQVSTTENPGRLTFSVTDTGEGILPELRDNIFERYKKANACVQGSGLGLHICSIIAEKLHAEIKLDKSYTNGARFVFVL